MHTHPSRRWIVLVYGVIMQAVTVGIGVYSFPFFIVPWMRDFGALRSTLMLAASSLAIATAILSPVCGYLLDRFSSRGLVLLGAGAYTLGLLAIAVAQSPVVIIAAFFLALSFGVLLAGTLMATSLVTRHFVEGRGTALGISALGTSLGGLLFPPLVTRLIESYGWRTMFIVLAGLVIVLVIVPALVILEQRGKTIRQTGLQGHGESGLRLMRSPNVIKLGVAYVAPVLLFLAVLHNLGALAADLSISQQHAAWIASTTSVIMMISKLVCGILCDRISHQSLYLAMLLIVAVGLSVASVASSYTVLLLGVSTLGVAAGGGLPIISSVAAARFGTESFGRVMGVVFAMAALSGIGSLVAGAIRDTGGSYSIAFLVLGLTLVPTVWCFLTLHSETDTGTGQTPEL